MYMGDIEEKEIVVCIKNNETFNVVRKSIIKAGIELKVMEILDGSQNKIIMFSVKGEKIKVFEKIIKKLKDDDLVKWHGEIERSN